jgi:hypothetical protein
LKEDDCVEDIAERVEKIFADNKAKEIMASEIRHQEEKRKWER